MEKNSEGSFLPNSTYQSESCLRNSGYLATVASLDILTVVMGQPMSAKLLWTTLTSKNKDVLNCNLALFHQAQYILLYIHLFFVFLQPTHQADLQKFLFVYVQVGGPMNLSLICLERYIAVIYPTSFPLLRKYRCREFCAAGVWAVSLTAAFIYVIGGAVWPESIENVTQAVPICLMTSLCVIMLYTSFSVARALRHSSVGKDTLHPVKRRAFITICITSAAALSCYIPVIAMQKYQFIDETKYNCRMVPMSIFFLSVASLIHPLLYLFARRELTCSTCSNKH